MRVLSCVFVIVLSKVYSSKFRAQKKYDDESPSALAEQIDTYPQKFDEPVPFGHMMLEGFVTDPKPPIDALELSMLTPMNLEEEIEFRKKDMKHIQFFKNTEPKFYASPRDKIFGEIEQQPIPEETKLKWYDLTELQIKNAMTPIKRNNPRRLDNRPSPRGSVQPTYNPGHSKQPENLKENYFANNKFELKKPKGENTVNWTTCDQFAVGAVFSPKEIVDLEWTPFFIWSLEKSDTAVVHKFTYPRKKLVNEYHIKYSKFLNETIDWSQPKLLMQGLNEMLLIAADRKGLFHAIVKHEIPDSAAYNPSIRLPSMTLRLKIEDPYLVMMYCEGFFATIMSISGNGPVSYNDMKAEAASIKFVGIGQPVWRDLAEERERKQIQTKAKLKGEDENIIKEPRIIPAVDEMDGLYGTK